ncbi:hypothetical protein JIN84_21555 [Luteolibacter yonseiensis]|uniref:DUF3102 domain-containing protein n=1 Tax=Luteolibacter yonseiensis TaxID=1144680 RepID=A0A934VDJ9_9BACT|nr:hypothetical protein [Luteolibacter yonseiensis]MBK1818225.1 hypothetical protein [Luteolibacter yonseiensis]
MNTLPKETTEAELTAPSGNATAQISPLSSIQADIENVQMEVAKLEDLSEVQLIKRFKNIAGRIADYEFSLSKSSLQAQLQRWLAGTLLNKRKRQLGHGKFGQWRKRKLIETGIMSERTSQRFMELAEKYEDPRLMLEEVARVHDADRLQELSPTEKAPKPKSGSITKTADLMASLTGLQRKLRVFQTSGERLKEEEANQLRLMKMQLDRFFVAILADEKKEDEAAERSDS